MPILAGPKMSTQSRPLGRPALFVLELAAAAAAIFVCPLGLMKKQRWARARDFRSGERAG